MRAFSVAALSAVLSLVSAGPLHPRWEVHEKREIRHADWAKGAKLHPAHSIPFRIGLKQQNLDHGERLLMEVSDPKSEKYGQHWSVDDVRDFFKPSEDTYKAVHDWLVSSGIAHDRHAVSHGWDWIELNATAFELKKLLKADYHIYEHGPTKTKQVACDHYSLPANIREHVDFVSPGIHFDAKLRKDPEIDAELKKRGGGALDIGTNHHAKHGDVADAKFNTTDLAGCSGNSVIPDCLRYTYGFTNPQNIHVGNSYGIVEYTPQAYRPADLDLFFSNFSPSMIGERPIFDSIDGGFLYQYPNVNLNGESDLDLEWAMAFVYPQRVTLFQVGDYYNGASFNQFLDGIDASYCTYEGGDDPNYDYTYPDPYPGNSTYSYKGPQDCGKFAPPKVLSTSYGYNEHDLPPAYEVRQCNEYMKLGLLGTSIFYSSGDDGVAGNSNTCIAPNGTYIPGARGGRFNPSFPATCPWITAVGATEFIPGVDVVKASKTNTQPERACATVIYSGGGFSNVFSQPAYQASAVLGFFQNHPPPYTAAQYNNSRTTRGFPDISSNGAHWVVAVDGAYQYRWYGTSLSSPTWGSIATLINNQRLKNKKSTIGFINPVLYSNTAALRDVTVGTNPGCATTGFNATVGWDPVTGLGTPIYDKLLKVFNALP